MSLVYYTYTGTADDRDKRALMGKMWSLFILFSLVLLQTLTNHLNTHKKNPILKISVHLQSQIIYCFLIFETTFMRRIFL